MTIYCITVHGWKNSGPVYSVHERLSGFSNRNNRNKETLYGVKGGRNVSEPAWHLVADSDGTEHWAVNRGHIYRFDALVDGVESHHFFDARDNFLSLSFGSGINIVEVSKASDSDIFPDNGDDEDGIIDDDSSEDE